MTQTALPTWNLKDFYQNIHDPVIETEMTGVQAEIDTFVKAYAQKLETLGAQDLYKAIQTFEAIQEKLSKPYCYGALLFAEDMNNEETARFFQTIKERVNTLSTSMLFFTLELNQLSEGHLQRLIEDSTDLKRYHPWLNDLRAFKPYQLPQAQEQILHEMRIASHSNWVRLHEETLASSRFAFDQEQLGLSDILDKMTDQDGAVRKKAARSFAEGLKKNIGIHTLVFNTLVKEKSVEDELRGFEQPIASRNVANLVEDEVVASLIATVKENYENLSHRYYKLKAKWFGVEKLPYWDRNAPLPQTKMPHFTWEEACELVLEAYRDFSPKMATIGQEFFDKNWIDAAQRPGKDSGAFSHSTIPSLHPYILTQFHGKPRDVATLAHELGHGIHQYLARPQGYLLADTPLTVAETASVFGEMLTFQKLLARTTSAEGRKMLIAGKVEDMLNTVVRQVAFCEFEREVHAARRQKELSAKDFAHYWLKTQKEALGPVFEIEEESYQYYWTYVSHFIHTPFYVYAYAFGDCLVNTLYATYESGFPGFQEQYLKMLSAGGSMRYSDMLKLFDLNAQDATFWQRGLDVISGFIDQLEKM